MLKEITDMITVPRAPLGTVGSADLAELGSLRRFQIWRAFIEDLAEAARRADAESLASPRPTSVHRANGRCERDLYRDD